MNFNPDFDGDGVVSVLDFNTFANLYAAKDLRADINGDGFVDVRDAALFINAAAEVNSRSAGFTVRRPSVDSRLVYVDPDSGSDSNDGSAMAPVATLAVGVTKLRNGFPDWLLLKRGTSYDVNQSIHLEFRMGRSPTEPMRVASYGDPQAPRPRLNVGDGRAAVSINGATNLDVFDLDIMGPESYAPATFGITGLGVWGVTIENCRVTRCANQIAVQADAGQSRSSARIRVRRCVLYGAGSTDGRASAVLFGGTDDLVIEGTYMISGGRGAGVNGAYASGLSPSVFSHNGYINPENVTNSRVSGCLIAYGAANGLRFCGDVCEDNVFFRNPNGIVTETSTRSVCRNFVDGCIDIGPTTPVGSIGGGVLGRNAHIADNVAVGGGSSGNMSGWTFTGDYGGLVFERNVVDGWAQAINKDSASLRLNGAPTSPITVINNTFRQLGGRILDRSGASPYARGGELWAGNRYESDDVRGPFMLGVWGYCQAADFNTAVSDSTSVCGPIRFVDEARRVSTYAAGGSEGLLAMCVGQERGKWDPRLDPKAISKWARDGYAPL